MESHAFSDHQASPSADHGHHSVLQTPEGVEPPHFQALDAPARKAKVYRVLHYHQHRALHGSLWHGTYSQAVLRPYVYAARLWLKRRQDDPAVIDALRRAFGLLETNRPALMRKTMRLHPRPERERARILFARLRHAQVTPVEVLTVYLAVAALIREDVESDKSADFLVVQVARALLRQSSGFYSRVYVDQPDGTTVRAEARNFFRGSGIVLRSIGAPIEEVCGDLADGCVGELLALKVREFGSHPTRRPGAKPRWCRAASTDRLQ